MSGGLPPGERGSAAGGHSGGPTDLEAFLWRRHRWVRPTIAVAAVAGAALAPERREVLLAFALLGYVPVAGLVAAWRERPAPLGLRWWLVLGSDAVALGLILALEPGGESIASMGAVLVTVVNAATFGARAGVAAGLALVLVVVAAHPLGEPHREGELALHLGGLVLAVAVSSYLVGRQAEDLRAQRDRAERHLEELERVDRFRRGLVSVLAHDVRGPLTAIRGGIATLTGLRGRLDAQEESDLLQGVARQAARLTRLTEGLLDLARLEEGRLTLDLREIRLRRAVSEALSFADPEGRIRVEIDPSIEVSADPDRLEQIVVNLATNCLRHGAAPYVASAVRGPSWVDLTFADAGPGVAPEVAVRLFEPFGATGDGGSVGLGLWIVRQLAEAHGGWVRHEANRPQGSRFTVRLPAPQVDGDPPCAPERGPGRAHG
jgi:signal transduction histidine kinase